MSESCPALEEEKVVRTRAELIAAVLADPDALWQLVQSKPLVAGPWRSSGPHTWWRPGCSVSHVYETEDDVVCISETPTHPEMATIEEAKAWIDATLRADGWLLARGE